MSGPSLQTPPDEEARLRARATLREGLDELARRGDRRRLRTEVKSAALGALRWWPVSLAAGPVGAVCWQAFGAVSGKPELHFGPAALVALLAVGPAAQLLFASSRAALRFRSDRAAALALFDRQHRPQDLLRSADEFLGTPGLDDETRESSFMRAAIDAAAAPLEASLRAPVPALASSRDAAPRFRWWGLGLAFGALLVAAWWPFARFAAGSRATPLELGATNSALTQVSRNSAESLRGVTKAPAPDASSQTAPRSAGAAPRQSERSAARASDETASALASQGAAAESMASGGGAASQAGKRQESAQPPRASRNADKEKAKEAQRPAKPGREGEGHQSSEADSGSGRARSSQGDAAQPGERTEGVDKPGAVPEKDVDEEAPEDTDEQQTSESAAQPLRNEANRDVDRNFSPDAGGEYNPDQRPNGRGGPGELKKSRGVPSMVLGIPVPDRVPGTPGAGRTKTSQELASPAAEKREPSAVGDYRARTGAVGSLRQPELTPWSRQLLERYFRHKAQSSGKPVAEAASEEP